MEIGTLVMMREVRTTDYHGIGVVTHTDEKERQAEGYKYSMVTVHWLDGMGVGLYWTDELEVI